MARHYADASIHIRVYFDDDGKTELVDQADDAVALAISIPTEAGVVEDYGREIFEVVELPS